MADLYTKIKLYLEANSKTWDDAVGLVDFNSDETGLTSWTVNGLAEPTAEQIASYETAANAEENLATVVSVRQYNYKSIDSQQFDKYIFKKIDASKNIDIFFNAPADDLIAEDKGIQIKSSNNIYRVKEIYDSIS